MLQGAGFSWVKTARSGKPARFSGEKFTGYMIGKRQERSGARKDAAMRRDVVDREIISGTLW